jgi:hypothetical protein
MKRLLTFIIAIAYFCISSGFVMNVHYCMGKVSKVNIEITPSKMCGCGKKQTKGCCKTESKLYKITDNHQASYADVAVISPYHILPNFYNYTYNAVAVSTTKDTYSSHAPPILRSQPIYILNCVFRI